MYKIIINYVLAVSLLASSTLVWAANPAETVILNYSGTVVIMPCTVDSSKEIDFGDMSSGDLATGKSSAWKSFQISMTNCSSTTTVIAEFDGLSSASYNYFASGGTAQHVGIELYDADAKRTIPPGTTSTATFGASQVFNYNVRLINDGSGDATNGTVNAVITINYTWK